MNKEQTLYVFDFDGTLTRRDTFVEIIRFAFGTWRCLLGFLRYLPQLVLMKAGRYPNWKAKQLVFTHFFGGMTQQRFHQLCRDFAASRSDLIRPSAHELLSTLLKEKKPVVVLSASPEDWVRVFFTDDVKVIATQLQWDAAGRLTGRFLTPNCYGPEKVRRLQAQYPQRDDYYLIAYGDSRGDRELLAYADEKHYKAL